MILHICDLPSCVYSLSLPSNISGCWKDIAKPPEKTFPASHMSQEALQATMASCPNSATAFHKKKTWKGGAGVERWSSERAFGGVVVFQWPVKYCSPESWNVPCCECYRNVLKSVSSADSHSSLSICAAPTFASLLHYPSLIVMLVHWCSARHSLSCLHSVRFLYSHRQVLDGRMCTVCIGMLKISRLHGSVTCLLSFIVTMLIFNSGITFILWVDVWQLNNSHHNPLTWQVLLMATIKLYSSWTILCVV